ncbi:MAG: hypothetical protein H5T96_09355 [Tissierellales bacterium]|nr:hypothetical protein [Tissierellales bacterium]
MELYRYYLDVKSNGTEWHEPTVDIALITYIPFKETPCGHWIKVNGKNKWVSKIGRKRFAYDDKKLALESFKIRTNKWRRIASNQVTNCDIALNLVRIKEEELKKT